MPTNSGCVKTSSASDRQSIPVPATAGSTPRALATPSLFMLPVPGACRKKTFSNSSKDKISSSSLWSNGVSPLREDDRLPVCPFARTAQRLRRNVLRRFVLPSLLEKHRLSLWALGAVRRCSLRVARQACGPALVLAREIQHKKIKSKSHQGQRHKIDCADRTEHHFSVWSEVSLCELLHSTRDRDSCFWCEIVRDLHRRNCSLQCSR